VVVAVKMGSPVYDSIAETLSKFTGYREEGRFEYLAVGREGDTVLHMASPVREGVLVERVAREIAKTVVKDLRRIVRGLTEDGTCWSERECFEDVLEYLKTARGCR